MFQLNVKLSRGVTQFSSFDQNFFQTATSVNRLGFFLCPDAGFRLIFFRKDFLNSILYK